MGVAEEELLGNPKGTKVVSGPERWAVGHKPTVKVVDGPACCGREEVLFE